MGVGAGLYMYVVVVQKFTFAISSPDEFLFLFTLPAGAVAKYCDEYACVCVCLSTRISPEPHARSLPIFVHVAYVRVDDRPHRLSAGSG